MAQPLRATPVATRRNTDDTQQPGRWLLVVGALAAGLCWSGVFSLLFLANLHAEADPLAPQRVFFYVLVIWAAMLTFMPVQQVMRLPNMALEGVCGTVVLLYTLAFVPPPTGWLFALPDLPVWLLMVGALFWTTAAVVLPFVYALGKRVFQHRARQLDGRRARRQAYEVGALVASIALLAALGVLNWVSLLLLVLILVTAEMLILSQVEVERG